MLCTGEEVAIFFQELLITIDCFIIIRRAKSYYQVFIAIFSPIT